jgi:hypothetical protein
LAIDLLLLADVRERSDAAEKGSYMATYPARHRLPIFRKVKMDGASLSLNNASHKQIASPLGEW